MGHMYHVFAGFVGRLPIGTKGLQRDNRVMFTRLLPRHLAVCLGMLQSRALSALLILTLVTPAGVQAADSLAAALELALNNPALALDERLASIDPDGAEGEEGSRQWLGGLPTLSVSYLVSNQAMGTDETEVNLNFPLKSPLQRRSDATLERVDPQLDSAVQRYRSWYLSGSLRQIFARDRQARAALPGAERGVALLAQMEAQLQQNLSAGNAELFDLITVQQQRLQAEGRLASLRAEIVATSRIYQGLTGEPNLPAVSGDKLSPPSQPLYDQYPSLELLDLNQQRALAVLRASSSNAQPWNLALVNRQLTVPSFSERQYGVAIDMPISFGAKPSSAMLSSERSLRRFYLMQRDNTLLSLRSNWEGLQAERATLLAQQARLAETLDSQSVAALIDQTTNSRELPIELRIQRMLALLDAQSRPGVVAAQLDANTAALRQLAGLSL